MNKEDRYRLLSLYASRIKDEPLRKSCVWLSAERAFLTGTAASRKHQAYEGGLADHTLEVIEIAWSTSQALYLRDIVNTDVVLAGAFWHDYGKIYDYQVNEALHPPSGMVVDPDAPEYIYTRHRWTIGHLSRSYSEFVIKAKECKVEGKLIEQVSHVILAHHGRVEWGSPKEPVTPEALIVHSADCLSGSYTEQKHVFDRPENGDWEKL